MKSEFEDLKRYTAYLNKFQKQFCVDIDSGNRNPKFQEYENGFKNNHPDVKITVDGSGESATLTFLDGTVDDADVYDYVGKFKEYRILSALNEKLSEWGYTGEYSRLHDVAGNSAGYDSAERNYFEKAILDSDSESIVMLSLTL